MMQKTFSKKPLTKLLKKWDYNNVYQITKTSSKELVFLYILCILQQII